MEKTRLNLILIKYQNRIIYMSLQIKSTVYVIENIDVVDLQVYLAIYLQRQKRCFRLFSCKKYIYIFELLKQKLYNLLDKLII